MQSKDFGENNIYISIFFILETGLSLNILIWRKVLKSLPQRLSEFIGNAAIRESATV